MRPRRAQRGVSLVLLLVIIVLGIIVLLANVGLSRLTGELDDSAKTRRHLERAAEALEAFAASAARLPCPADPTLDDGLERAKNNVAAGTTGLCEFPAGTLPWKTIGLSRAESFDAWDLKISYRVYTGNSGSLTQANGVSMVECDTNEPSSGAATSIDAGTNTGRLCKSDASSINRSTTPEKFLQGKGLTLDDNGTNHGDVAYVLISHGITGYGAYTRTGTRRTMPGGEEERNTRDTGSFTVRAFSDADTEASKATHFDDLVVYRRIPDLVSRIKLAARDWPDHLAMVFDAATVARGTGNPAATITTGSLGRSSLTYNILTESGSMTATVTGVTGGSDSTLSFDDTYGGTGGIGVYGAAWFFGVGTNLILSSANESLRFDLSGKLRKFAITLNDFGQPTYFVFFFPFSQKFVEQVQFTFYDTTGATPATPVMTAVKAACGEPDGILASFSIDVTADFNRVEVKPLDATPALGYPSGFLVSSFVACTAASASCVTPLATTGTGGNTCP